MEKILWQDENRVAFETENENEIVLRFTDDIVDGRGNVKGSSTNKAAVNASMTAHIFKVLSGYHVPTYFKSQKSANELLLKGSEIFPVKITVANEANEEGVITPTIQYVMVADDSETPVEPDELVANETSTVEQVADFRRYTLKVNVVLRNFFERRHLELLGFSIQFGVVNGNMAVCSELTLDTCDLKDAQSRTKFTTAYIISHLDNATELYEQARDMIIY